MHESTLRRLREKLFKAYSAKQPANIQLFTQYLHTQSLTNKKGAVTERLYAFLKQVRLIAHVGRHGCHPSR